MGSAVHRAMILLIALVVLIASVVTLGLTHTELVPRHVQRSGATRPPVAVEDSSHRGTATSPHHDLSEHARLDLPGNVTRAGYRWFNWDDLAVWFVSVGSVLVLSAGMIWHGSRWRLHKARQRMPQPSHSSTASAYVPVLPAHDSLPLRADPLSVPTDAAQGTPWQRSEAGDMRVGVVASAVLSIFHDRGWQSSIAGLETTGEIGAGVVTLWLDIHPAEQGVVRALPEVLMQRQSTWRVDHHNQSIRVQLDAQPIVHVRLPLLLPLLQTTHSAGYALRYVVWSSIQHLGLYGHAVMPTLHGILTEIVCRYAPSRLALTIFGGGAAYAGYQHVPHWVHPPCSSHAALLALAERLSKPPAITEVRPTLVVIIEPNPAVLQTLIEIERLLRASPPSLVHLVVVQQRVTSAGRDWYMAVPALLLADGGDAGLIPGGAWPPSGYAKIRIGDMVAVGQPPWIAADEAIEMMGLLPQFGGRSRLTIWDYIHGDPAAGLENAQ